MEQRLKLMWHCDDKCFEIGQLNKKDSRYYFSYNEDGAYEAAKFGFVNLKGFPRINSKYYSERPFKLFCGWAGVNEESEDFDLNTFAGLSNEGFTFEHAE